MKDMYLIVFQTRLLIRVLSFLFLIFESIYDEKQIF